MVVDADVVEGLAVVGGRGNLGGRHACDRAGRREQRLRLDGITAGLRVAVAEPGSPLDGGDDRAAILQHADLHVDRVGGGIQREHFRNVQAGFVAVLEFDQLARLFYGEQHTVYQRRRGDVRKHQREGQRLTVQRGVDQFERVPARIAVFLQAPTFQPRPPVGERRHHVRGLQFHVGLGLAADHRCRRRGRV